MSSPSRSETETLDAVETVESADEVAELRARLESYEGWIRTATEVCQRAAVGDLEPRILHIDAEGDLGELLHSINHMLDLTDALAATE